MIWAIKRHYLALKYDIDSTFRSVDLYKIVKLNNFADFLTLFLAKFHPLSPVSSQCRFDGDPHLLYIGGEK